MAKPSITALKRMKELYKSKIEKSYSDAREKARDTYGNSRDEIEQRVNEFKKTLPEGAYSSIERRDGWYNEWRITIHVPLTPDEYDRDTAYGAEMKRVNMARADKLAALDDWEFEATKSIVCNGELPDFDPSIE